MSTSQAGGGIVGAVAGYIIGNGDPSAVLRGFQWGYFAGSLLNPSNVQVSNGPRLTDLSYQTSTYGAGIPRVYGSAIVYGNVIWLENNQLKEVATRHKVKTGFRSHKHYYTYAYYATFTVGLCEGPIAGVRRIWIGTNLVYDASAMSLEQIMASNQSSELFTIYKGSNTQVADPRMQQTLGASNTPAYRGLAYVVFKDLALQKYGNTLMNAQVKVEVIKSGISYSDYALQAQLIAPIAPANRPQTDAMTRTYVDAKNGIIYYFVPDAYWAWADYPPYTLKVYAQNITGGAIRFERTISIPMGNYGRPVLSIISGGGDNPFPGFCVTGPGTNGGVFFIDYKGVVRKQLSAADFSALGGAPGGVMTICVDEARNRWLFCNNQPNSWFYNSHNQIRAATWDTNVKVGEGLDVDRYVVDAMDVYNGYVYSYEKNADTHTTAFFRKYSIVDMSLVGNVSTGGANYVMWNLACFADDCFYTSGNFDVYRFENFALTGSISGRRGVNSYAVLTERGGAYCQEGVFWSFGYCTYMQYAASTQHVRAQSNSYPTLSSIVSAESLKSNLLTASDIDVTQLTPTVRGFKVTKEASIRSGIEPLQGLYKFDIVQVGYKIKFITRGKTSIATVSANELAAKDIT